MIENSFLCKLIKKPHLITKLDFNTISEILEAAREIFEDEFLLLEFDLDNSEEALVIGDIHGNLETLIKLLEIIEQEKPKLVISLGDIVDRGANQLECLIVILAYKILNPESFFILKGNHETFEMNQSYGFFYEFLGKFKDPNKFKEILAIYEVLPLCAIVNKSILCLHGGIPEDTKIFTKLKGLKPRNIDQAVMQSIEEGIFQMMWNDPKEALKNFKGSFRGPGINFFGKEVFEKFLEVNNLKYLIRAHECFPEGYRWFFDDKLLSIFSAANYRGPYSNPASYALIRNNIVIPQIIEL